MDKNLIKFLGICVPIRFLLVIFSYFMRNKQINSINYIGTVIAILIALGFIYNENKTKGYFGSNKYWSGILHALLFIIFGILFSTLPKYAWNILLLDLIIGIYTVLYHYK
jgi:hypothetical protein